MNDYIKQNLKYLDIKVTNLYHIPRRKWVICLGATADQYSVSQFRPNLQWVLVGEILFGS